MENFMDDFIASDDRLLLEQHKLNSFEALWALQLDAVDAPNTGRSHDGWSSVYRLELDGRVYYLKRQRNHLTRNLAHPLGEPTFAREFRSIQRYQKRNVPALSAAFYAQRRMPDNAQCAILLTHALEGWHDMESQLAIWNDLPAASRDGLLTACGQLVRRLHQARLVHGCLYPRHVFVRATTTGFDACLIDLEKTRPLWRGRLDRVKDLEQFTRHTPALSATERDKLLAAYLGCAADSPEINTWRKQLLARKKQKEGR
jgi:tRNA A-37 threonylcarbamoyl transferase component Bud32